MNLTDALAAALYRECDSIGGCDVPGIHDFQASAILEDEEYREAIRAALGTLPTLELPTGTYVDIEYVFDMLTGKA